jgi:hypothetical protein
MSECRKAAAACLGRAEPVPGWRAVFEWRPLPSSCRESGDAERLAAVEGCEGEGEAGDPDAAEQPAAEYVGGPVHAEVDTRHTDEEDNQRARSRSRRATDATG